tara:strand:+ start:2892 stop:4766 length:1875 start_codon:yes stop_codon:yes gene_type:complete
MKDLLLIEKSKFSVTQKEGADKYVFEGIFTEFDSENRNGRVYTKKEFQPHFDELKKIVESGTCVGELDHPKQFETTLKNVAHKIEDIWIDESKNLVMGRIRLLDTIAGKQAKALVDGGIPLHISSRAAGTVTENKTVKIHKLFTYDLVDTPGFANARMNGVNESFGMINESAELDTFSDFSIFEVEDNKDNTKGSNSNELNIKNNDNEKMDKVEYIKESEFNKYTDFTKDAIETVKSDLVEMKEIQESIIEQNDSIVDEYSNADFKSKLEAIDETLSGIQKWSEHVTESVSILETNNGGELGPEDKTIKYHVGQTVDGKVVSSIQKTDDGKTSIHFEGDELPVIMEAQAPLAKADTLQVGATYNGGTITQVEVQDDGSTKVYLDSEDEPIIVGKTKVDDLIDDTTMQEKLSNMESKYSELEAKFEAMINWSQHATSTVSALEEWSNHSSDTVTGLEENAKSVEKWSEHVTESVSKLEESVLNETKKETIGKIEENKVSDFKESIYNRLEVILEAKEQEATKEESLNESKSNEVINESPLWMTMMPAKYAETWKGLDESEQLRITKRANLFEFGKESAIKDFWNNEFTKVNLIKEEKIDESVEAKQAAINERRMDAVKGYKQLFN